MENKLGSLIATGVSYSLIFALPPFTPFCLCSRDEKSGSAKKGLEGLWTKEKRKPNGENWVDEEGDLASNFVLTGKCCAFLLNTPRPNCT